jgi:hypothetical protein
MLRNPQAIDEEKIGLLELSHSQAKMANRLNMKKSRKEEIKKSKL